MKARRVKRLDPAAPLRPNAVRIVRTRLEELLSFAEKALVPGGAEAQHDMRIAAKRLRYALELVGPCIGDAAEPARRAAKEIQSALGDLHDCDVILPEVESIPSLAVAVRRRRERNFQTFAELWGDDATGDAWAALERAL